jgi:hypothetical protein
MKFQEALDVCVTLLRQNKTVPWSELAAKCGVHKDKLRGKARRIVRSGGGAPEKGESFTFEQKNNDALAELNTKRVVTLEDLLTHCKVDLSVWRVDKWVANKWEVGAKDAAGNVVVSPLYQVKAWLVRSDVVAHTEAAIEHLLKRIKPKDAPPPHKTTVQRHVLEVAVPDLHIGKLVVAPNGSRTYDTATAVHRFKDAVTRLLAKAVGSGVEISRILLPVGNDLLHVDNGKNTTTNGTPQDVDGLWHEAFVAAEEAILWAIEHLRTVAPVDVVMIRGNHDSERVFSLGRIFKAYFRNDDQVTFDLSPHSRKYYAFGNNMVMFSHGDGEKVSDLPLIMATEAPKMWAESIYREAHLGHFHHKKTSDEFTGVRTKFLPSLAESDFWHSHKGYIGNVKSAEAYLWSADGGIETTFHVNYNHK